jgi:agmatinase
MGVPLDCTSTYRPGSRFAPLEIRKELLELEKDADGRNFFDLKFHDAGNVDMIYGNAGKTLEIIEEAVGDILKENAKAKIISLGGEHLITLPVVKKLLQKEKFSVVSLDAHLDLKDDYVGEKLSHSTVMRRISELGVSVLEIGVRTYDNNELDYAKREVKFCGTDEGDISKILAGVKGDVYLSIDMDVLDPAFAPGVENPEPGGMAFNQLRGIMEKLGKKIIALDITEVCPPYDQGGMTSVAAARLLLDFMLQ